jgi:DNA-binding MarR family transcriptional regulator
MPSDIEVGAAALHRTGMLPDVVLEHTSCALGRLGQALMRLTEQRLRTLGVRARHIGVLMALRAGGPISQQALGTYLAIDAATIVAALNDLEERGFVRRERDGVDARRHAVTLTELGYDFLEQAEQVLDGIDDEVLVVLAPRLQRALAEAVRQLATSPQVAGLAEAPGLRFGRVPERDGATVSRSGGSQQG